MIIPVGVDYRANRYPMVTFSLIGLNTVIWLASLFAGSAETLAEFPASWHDSLFLVPASSPWYCWVTSMFVHGGLFHLLGNMVYLFLFGSPVEDMMGRWQFAVFYLLGGLVADTMHVAFTAEHFASTMPLGGASGAISACMGAFALLMFRSKIEFKWFFLLFFRFYSGEFFAPTWLVMSFWFLMDLLGAFLSVGDHDGGTAFGAHVGGFVGGMLMILVVKQLWQRGVMRMANLDEDEDEPAVAVAVAKPAGPIRVQAREVPAIYIHENGSQIGPFTTAQIREMVALGSVSAEAWYWREGMAEWQGVGEITQS